MNPSFLEQNLFELESKSLRRHWRMVQSPQSKEIILDGKRVLNFCSNNYLGLADDERIKQAALEAVRQDGFGSGASRLVCGTLSAHVKLEEKLARLKNTESALVFSSGYMANTGIIPALFGRDDVILSDRLNHASIVDGILLSRAKLKRYAHKDMQDLEDALKNSGSFKKRLIVTDTIFSMDGDTTPLQKIVDLARRYEAWVMVDEAHAFGVLGEHGAGLVEEENLGDHIDIQMGTLSKAAGCFGAYAAGSKSLCDYLTNHSRSFIYTTAMPPACAAAASVAVDIIAQDKERRHRLLFNADYLRRGLQALGFDTMQSATPIIPIVVKDSVKALEASRRLLEQGIFVQAIRPPTVPVNTARLRVTVMATHTEEDLDLFLDCIQKI
ncbi:MAG: 8-amino-7-oxononanoate synthase [Candidatus Omnitrophica bacterium]|nr:8-amino-7-oxononanoate synthase [Candidatus Omnitrophota bacterium]